MNSTQVFDTQCRMASLMPVSGADKSALTMAARKFFHLLERLNLCRAPRIVSVTFLHDEPGIIRNEA